MPGTVITDLRQRGAVDPGRLLSGPLRVVGLQWLEPGHSAEVTSDGVEHALYVTAGSGLASAPEEALRDGADDSGIPLVQDTAVVLPLGSRTVLTAGTAGLEYFHAVLAVPAGAVAGDPDSTEAPNSPDSPESPNGGEPR
ncbi:hypothetical protein [Kitasatospora sp. NPDC097643]|uniref:hypothetical protein n=1 Tax=Kitasatospora sp. NPDC097643 TaxID=3157230 RepID=UPI00331FD35D